MEKILEGLKEEQSIIRKRIHIVFNDGKKEVASALGFADAAMTSQIIEAKQRLDDFVKASQ